MNGKYLAIAGRIRGELIDIERVVARTLMIWQAVGQTGDDYYLDATALNLHGFYAGVERIFEMIADGVDQTKPTTRNWHQALLQQMSVEIPRTRPAVLSSESRTQLDKFRGFRHVVRNIYTFNFDPPRIEELVQQLPTTMTQLSQELLTFADFLEEVAD